MIGISILERSTISIPALVLSCILSCATIAIHFVSYHLLLFPGIMCELLWSDPQPQNGRSLSKRGVGCQFGPDVTKRFLEKNNLDYVIRSHEVRADGYEIAHDGKCITVFSAPNYWSVHISFYAVL